MLQRKHKKANINVNTIARSTASKARQEANLENVMEYHFCRLEQKIAAAKADIYKFFIKSFLAQTSILICLIFALMDFLLKK
jgi:hypothetical protein